MCPLGIWLLSGICVWIPCIKETMMMIIIITIIIINSRYLRNVDLRFVFRWEILV